MINSIRVGKSIEEFTGAQLGDERRAERLEVIVGQLEQDPSKSFPRAMGSDAALEGFYRFINNDGFGAADILAPHLEATMKRARALRTVVAVHDTTNVEYGGKREDLGPTSSKHHFGFVAHVVLMVDEEECLPLGVAHLETLIRTGKKWAKRRKEGQRVTADLQDKTRESLRWIRGVDAVESLGNDEVDIVHVTDAEGDFFELLAYLEDQDARFVIRAGQLDRVVLKNGEPQNLRELADAIVPATWREVDLSERKHPRRTNIQTRIRHPERNGRRAKLAIGATRIALQKTRYCGVRAATFEVNVVRVWEPNPPPGQPPVEWVLITTEDCTSKRKLERIVDLYRKRWMIEEYFKALKSGCALEQRQVESYDALRKVLALFIPIAYRLLLLRALERLDPTAPASRAFSSTDLELMQQAPSNRKLPRPRTVADALAHLARLGGHIRNNGRPGWQTLSWGYQKLLTMRMGWEIAMSKKCDQS
jgi:hypothetical protein